MPRFLDTRPEDKEEAEAPAPVAPPPPGTHLLFEGPALASWFVTYRLEQELERARRYGSCLCVLIAEPQLLGGERPSEAQRTAAAETARASARSTDLVGWYKSHGVIIVLPEADAASARFAAARMRDEIWIRRSASGNQKWQIRLIDDLDEIQALLPPRAATSADGESPEREQAA